MVAHGYMRDNEMESAEPRSRCSSTATNPHVPGSINLQGTTDEILQKTTASSPVPAKHNSNDGDAGAVAVNYGKRFMSQIFDIYVGPDRHRFTAHEAFLARSQRIKSMCTSQTVKKGNSKAATTLIFAHHNPEQFGHLLEYLYFNTISLPASEPLVEAKRLTDLFSLANKFQLDEMQEDIIARLKQSEISSRISPMQFFNLAEDLYTEDKDCGLHAYFAKAAPPLIRAAQTEDLPELERMIAEGGEFAQALFAAYREAFGPKAIEESVETSDANKVIEVETETNQEPISDNKDQHEAKKIKLSPPPTPPILPCSQENLNHGDKTLIRLRTESSNWNHIRREWEQATGEKASIKTLVSRYRHIFWWNMKNGYMPLLLSAEAYVRSKFESEKWNLVAQSMVLRGAGIKFPSAALRMAFLRLSGEGEEKRGGGEEG